jgi:hypothetical protein
VDLDLYNDAFAKYLGISKYSTDPAADMSFAIQPVGKAAVAAGIARGGNSLGLVASEQTCKASQRTF